MKVFWLMTLLICAFTFFLVYLAVYFFRPRKRDKLTADPLAKELIDPEEIVPRSPRAEPNWSAYLHGPAGENIDVNVANISESSAFIACTNPLPVGALFDLTINIPDRQPMKVKAEVIWNNSNLPDSKVVKRGMGVRIIEAEAEDILFISSTITQVPDQDETAKTRNQEGDSPPA